jgi:hypothetical protein
MPGLTVLATPESERRLREFWAYGGDRFPLTGPEWRFVTTLVVEAPALSGVGASFNWGYMTVSIGQLGEGLSSLLNYRPVADPWIGLPPAERGPSIIGRPAR